MKNFWKFFLVSVVSFGFGAWLMHQIDKGLNSEKEIDSKYDEDDDYYDDEDLDYSDLGLDSDNEPKIQIEVVERDPEEVAASIKVPGKKLTEKDIFTLSEEELAEAKKDS